MLTFLHTQDSGENKHKLQTSETCGSKDVWGRQKDSETYLRVYLRESVGGVERETCNSGGNKRQMW